MTGEEDGKHAGRWLPRQEYRGVRMQAVFDTT